MKKFFVFLLLLTLAFTGCGSSNKNNEADPQTGDPSDLGPAPEDTWFNAEGQYGTVSYVYDKAGRPETTTYTLTSGKAWRILKHSHYEDNAWGGMVHEVSVRDANQNRLINLNIIYHKAEDGSLTEFPKNIDGYDFMLSENACSMTYQDDGLAISTLHKNTYNGAQNHWVIHWKNAKQIDHITEYYRDYTKAGTWKFYYQNDTITYIAYMNDYILSYPSALYKAEYDQSGALSGFRLGKGYPDDKGNVSRFTPLEPQVEDLIPGIWLTKSGDTITRIDWIQKQTRTVWEFSENKTVYYHTGVGNELSLDNKATFTFNKDGTVHSQDFGYLGGSLGGGDTSYYVYTYGENGLVKSIKGYWQSLEHEEELDLEWEYTFTEEGWKDTFTTFSSGKYVEKHYDKDGKQTERVTGTYTEDGTKVPDSD